MDEENRVISSAGVVGYWHSKRGYLCPDHANHGNMPDPKSETGLVAPVYLGEPEEQERCSVCGVRLADCEPSKSEDYD